MEVSEDHPRYRSLVIRERMAEMARDGVVAETGLIAHGRGEAFDYLLGERTTPEGERAEKVVAAFLLEARNPVISINGNVAALAPLEIIALAESVPALMEVNLFHRTEERVARVCDHMERMGARGLLGRNPDTRLEGIASERALCTREGLGSSDAVLVPLEDGDRAEALVRAGKVVMTIDLNPLSRTSRAATVSIVDELTRAIPCITKFVRELRGRPSERRDVIEGFDNRANLAAVGSRMCEHVRAILGESKG